jgi:hypothetical protein
VVLAMAPLYFSSYVLGLRVPEVSLTMENIADFVSAYVVGNLLQMAFRFWAFRRWVFPDELARHPDRAIEASITAGGIAEAIEDEIEDGHGSVTPLRPWRARHENQLGDSSEPKVSKTS